ncbi:hypothetical protein [Nonomuraea sp. NPDC005650]|uniref:hypothetical protein n=1 Tax=Nonomuraea sp. NPDC005650 TaxID=3157045 RepID=UPI0033AA2E26
MRNTEGAWRVGLVIGIVIGLAALGAAWPALTALVDELIASYGVPSPTISGGTL